MKDARAYLDYVQKCRWNSLKVNMAVNLLGPQQMRMFPPAEQVWTYTGQSCMGLGYSALDEDIYVDDAKKDLKTSFSLARPTTGIRSENGKNCLGPIIETRIS